nr:DUF2550 domain-containing protein [Psychromicrobium sp. YIM S02556]
MGAVFLAILLLIAIFIVRRALLRGALGTVDASIRPAGHRWRMGVCRYQDTDLEWFRLLSLSPLPRYSYKRSSLELLGRRDPTEGERAHIQPDCVIVLMRYEGQELMLAMKFEAYIGLSSWLEAGPVVGVGTWR